MLKLNLGCGDKLLEGHINIDHASSRRGIKPDVEDDIRCLTDIAEGTIDEILAVHVIEHFYRWEVNSILRNWFGLLKTGGKIILECPNLLFACEQILKDPLNACLDDKRGQLSMWPLYGDPSWADPLMCHKWAYTPQTLITTLESAGFTNARQEKAMFKLREPRDMRIVAEKLVQIL